MKKKLVLYYTNWSQYRQPNPFVPEDIDPQLCTHINYSFAKIQDNELKPIEWNDESMYKKVIALKKQNPDLKVLLAVGGWNAGSEGFRSITSNRQNMDLFISSIVRFLRDRGFDGLDIDWEYPGVDDKDNFVQLLKGLRIAFNTEASNTSRSPLLLTAAVPAIAEKIEQGYSVKEVSDCVDFLNIMTYDFHGDWESVTGHNSPLYALPSQRELCMDYATKLWERLGTPKHKIVVGMATYGHKFNLMDPTVHGMNAPATGAGTLPFFDVCPMIKCGAQYVWDDIQKVPYLIQGVQWVGFDDERSISGKMDWLLENNYAGAMVWSIDMDDFRGQYSSNKYPLISLMAGKL